MPGNGPSALKAQARRKFRSPKFSLIKISQQRLRVFTFLPCAAGTRAEVSRGNRSPTNSLLHYKKCNRNVYGLLGGGLSFWSSFVKAKATVFFRPSPTLQKSRNPTGFATRPNPVLYRLRWALFSMGQTLLSSSPAPQAPRFIGTACKRVWRF